MSKLVEIKFPSTIISVRPDGKYDIALKDTTDFTALHVTDGCQKCPMHGNTKNFASGNLIYAAYCTGFNLQKSAELDIYSTGNQTHDEQTLPDAPCGANPSYLVMNNVKQLIID